MNEPTDEQSMPNQQETIRPPGHPRSDFFKTVFGVVLLASAFGLWLKNAGNGPLTGGLTTGNRAPEIKAIGWAHGEAPTAAALEGKVIVVNAWATWCVNCRVEAPELVKVYEKFRDREVAFIGLTAEGPDSRPAIEEFLADAGVEWPNGFGAVDTLLAFQAEYIPAVWVINPAGQVVWNRDSPEAMEVAIEAALNSAERQPPSEQIEEEG